MDAKTAEERISPLSVEKAYGSVKIEVKTAGTFYLNGIKKWHIPEGRKARVTDLETGTHSLEMRYDNGESETKSFTVVKDREVQLAFDYVEQIRTAPIRISRGTVYFNNKEYVPDFWRSYRSFYFDLEKLPYLSNELKSKINEYIEMDEKKATLTQAGFATSISGIGFMLSTLIAFLAIEDARTEVPGLGIGMVIGGGTAALTGLVISIVGLAQIPSPTEIIDIYNAEYTYR